VAIRLNGWHRIGIILSMVWVVVVCSYAAHEYLERGASTTLFIDVTPDKAPIVNKQGRVLDYVEFKTGEPRLLIVHLIAATLLPMALAWAIAYLCAFAFRWVAAGFRSNETGEH
jgi:hypothetical protein